MRDNEAFLAGLLGLACFLALVLATVIVRDFAGLATARTVLESGLIVVPCAGAAAGLWLDRRRRR